MAHAVEMAAPCDNGGTRVCKLYKRTVYTSRSDGKVGGLGA